MSRRGIKKAKREADDALHKVYWSLGRLSEYASSIDWVAKRETGVLRLYLENIVEALNLHVKNISEESKNIYNCLESIYETTCLDD